MDDLLVAPVWAVKRMKGSEHSVYMETALHIDKQKRSTSIPVKAIADGLEMQERQIRRLLKSMNEKGVIRIEKRPGNSSVIYLPLEETP